MFETIIPAHLLIGTYLPILHPTLSEVVYLNVTASGQMKLP
jgi:hypothetical protein